MSYRELKSYQDFIFIPMKDRWTKCTVGLEHSVSGDYYWLTCFMWAMNPTCTSTLEEVVEVTPIWLYPLWKPMVSNKR